jgi:hydrogenase maturation factor
MGMIDSIASALAEQVGIKFRNLPADATGATPGMRRHWRRLAAAALTAMQDPTAGMIEAGKNEVVEWETNQEREDVAKGVYLKMIRSALEAG